MSSNKAIIVSENEEGEISLVTEIMFYSSDTLDDKAIELANKNPGITYHVYELPNSYLSIKGN